MNLNKSVGPNSIPTRILKLFKIGISTQLAEYLTSHFLKASFQVYLKQPKMSLFIKRIPNWIFQITARFPILKKILDKPMYSRIYIFFNKNNLIYPLQFGFRWQYSTFHALISHTKDKGKLDCGIFIDLLRVFDTVEHDI